jgi:hypothetical protein
MHYVAGLDFVIMGLCCSIAVYAASEHPATPICKPNDGIRLIDRVTDDATHDAWKVYGKDTKCHVHFFDMPEIRECLADQWLIILGGSNAVSTCGAALGLFNHQPYESSRKEFFNCPDCDNYNGMILVYDAIISKDGTREWTKSTPTQVPWAFYSPEEWQLDPGFNEERGAWLLATLKEAPRPSRGAVRITWVYARFFQSAREIASRAWKAVPFMPPPHVHINVGVWYPYCAGCGDTPGCPEMCSVFNNNGGYLEVFKLQYKRMMEDFKTLSPEMRVVIRNQAYSDWNMFPIFNDVFEALPKPHNITLLNWQYEGAEWNYVWDFPNVGSHPAHAGSNIILQQHFNLICPVPKVPIAASVIVFPRAYPCIGESIDYYVGTTRPGCWPAAYQILSDDAASGCRPGTVGDR